MLKGPQGTLFGASSTGGAINFIAAKPTNHFEAGGDATYGRFNRGEINAYISGPISDTLKGRVAVNAVRQDGWQYSQTRPDDHNGGQRYVTARAILDWQPTDTLKFEAEGNGFYDKSPPQAPQFKAYSPQKNPATVTKDSATGVSAAIPYETFPFAPNNDRAADWDTTLYTGPANNHLAGTTIDGHPRGLQKMIQGSLRGDWEFIPDVSLTSITSYADFNRNLLTEQDGTPSLATDYTSLGHIHTFNQEVRIANSGHQRFRWIVGGNYEHTNTYEAFQDFWPAITLSQPGVPFASTIGYEANMEQRLRNYAGFANGEFDILPKVTIKGGVRYTENRRSVDECSHDNGDGTFNAIINNFGAPLAAKNGVVYHPATGQQCAEINDTGVNGAAPTYQPEQFTGTLNEHNVSWRGGIDYKPNRDTLLYFNAAKGWKAGTYPFIGGTDFKLHAPVTQESLLDFEGGAKLQLFDRKLSLNMAGFYYDYHNKQLRSKVPDPNFGALGSLIGVPKSTLYGFEADASLRPLEGMSITAGFTYTHTKINDFFGYPASGIPPTVATPKTDFAGSLLPYVSKFNTNVSWDYRWQVGEVHPFVGLTWTYRSSQFTTIGGSDGIVVRPEFRSEYPFNDLFKIPGYMLVDLRAGVSGPDDKWSVSVYGKNVTNQYYFTNILPVYDGVVRYTGMPATWGVTFGVKFR